MEEQENEIEIILDGVPEVVPGRPIEEIPIEIPDEPERKTNEEIQIEYEEEHFDDELIEKAEETGEISEETAEEIIEEDFEEIQEVEKEYIEEENIQMNFLEYMPITPSEDSTIETSEENSVDESDIQSEDAISILDETSKKEASKYVQIDVLRNTNSNNRRRYNQPSKDKLHLYVEIAGNFAKFGNDFIVVTGVLTRNKAEIERRTIEAKEYMDSLLDPSYMQKYNEKKQAHKYGNIFRIATGCRYTNGISLVIQQSDLKVKARNPKIYKYFFISKLIDLFIEKNRLGLNCWKMIYIHLNEKDFNDEERVSLMYYLKIRQRLEKERPLKFTILKRNPQIHPTQRAVQIMSKAIYLPVVREDRDHIYRNRYKIPGGYIIEYYKHE